MVPPREDYTTEVGEAPIVVSEGCEPEAWLWEISLLARKLSHPSRRLFQRSPGLLVWLLLVGFTTS